MDSDKSNENILLCVKYTPFIKDGPCRFCYKEKNNHNK
jgi:hypothetical protein